MGRHRLVPEAIMARSLSALLVLAIPLAAVAAPALKSAGDRILYVLADDEGMQVWSVKDDGTGAEKLTKGPGDHLFPAWSPDGRMIAYTLQSDQGQHIYVMSADGKDAKKITKDTTGNRGAA